MTFTINGFAVKQFVFPKMLKFIKLLSVLLSIFSSLGELLTYKRYYDTTNFVNIFNNYKIGDLRWKPRFVQYMQQLIPSLVDLDSSVLYDKLVLKMIFKETQYDLTDVSEGTLKGLILNTIINMPMKQKCSLLAIDEPEMNLHPAWQKVVGNWIQTSGTFDQCFISTHSPDFLDIFTEGFKAGDVAVFVFGSGETHCSIKMITYEEIAEELGDWELGDLYRTNDPALGGWPW